MSSLCFECNSGGGEKCTLTGLVQNSSLFSYHCIKHTTLFKANESGLFFPSSFGGHWNTVNIKTTLCCISLLNLFDFILAQKKKIHNRQPWQQACTAKETRKYSKISKAITNSNMGNIIQTSSNFLHYYNYNCQVLINYRESRTLHINTSKALEKLQNNITRCSTKSWQVRSKLLRQFVKLGGLCGNWKHRPVRPVMWTTRLIQGQCLGPVVFILLWS